MTSDFSVSRVHSCKQPLSFLPQDMISVFIEAKPGSISCKSSIFPKSPTTRLVTSNLSVSQTNLKPIRAPKTFGRRCSRQVSFPLKIPPLEYVMCQGRRRYQCPPKYSFYKRQENLTDRSTIAIVTCFFLTKFSFTKAGKLIPREHSFEKKIDNFGPILLHSKLRFEDFGVIKSRKNGRKPKLEFLHACAGGTDYANIITMTVKSFYFGLRLTAGFRPDQIINSFRLQCLEVMNNVVKILGNRRDWKSSSLTFNALLLSDAFP